MNIQKTLTSVLTVLSAASLLSASAAPLPVPPTPQAAQQESAQHVAPHGPLTVSYYDGNPAQGGKLLKTIILQERIMPKEGSAGHHPMLAPKGMPKDHMKPENHMKSENHMMGKDSLKRSHHSHHGHVRLDELRAQAPAGATFAVVRDGEGHSRTYDLRRAERHQKRH